MKLFRIDRTTKRTHIVNRYSFGDWYENVTTISLTFLGFKIKTIHKYFISYRGELCSQ